MKIAVTADIHLKADDKEGNKYPERLNALRYILDSILKDGIRNLIIAVDLFDIESQNYSVFDQLCRESKYSGINIYIVPGNHDPAINPKYFTAASIKVFSDPKILTLNNSSDFLQEASPGSASTDADLLSFFFIPYVPGKSMGEILAEYKQILPRRWVLIGHGDYLSGIKIPNIYETGVYMPL